MFLISSLVTGKQMKVLKVKSPCDCFTISLFCLIGGYIYEFIIIHLLFLSWCSSLQVIKKQ